MKEFIRTLVRNFFVIYTGSMFATFCFCTVFYPDTKLEISYILWMFVFSLCADLPSLVFYSKKELSKVQFRIRQVFHLLLLEAVLLTAAGIYGMYHGLFEGFCFGLLVVCVYVGIVLVLYWLDWGVANVMNKKLRGRREKRCDE